MYLKFLDLLLKLSPQGLLIFNFAKKLADFKVLPERENDGLKSVYFQNQQVHTERCVYVPENKY